MTQSRSPGRGTTDFNAEYQDQLERAKGGAAPVGGVPMPAIPRLDSIPTPDRFTGIGGNMQPMTASQIAELQRRGEFIPGVGSAYAVNQPGGTRLETSQPYQNPPRPEGSGLRPETIQSIEKAAAQQVVAEEDVKKDLREAEEEFDFEELGNRVKTELTDKRRKRIIEARCEPMSLEDLLLQQEVRQRVPIVPGKFEPTYRSSTGSEDLFVKRLIGSENGSEQYITDRFTLMNLCISLFAVNGKPLKSHLNSNNDPEEGLFNEKFKMLMKYPMPILSDLCVNAYWFERRVRKLLVIEDIKNF